MKKFGKLPGANTVIPSRLSKFIMQGKLTQASLFKLEKEISEALKHPKAEPAQASNQAQPKVDKPMRPASAKPPKQEENVKKQLQPAQKENIEDDFFGEKKRIDYNEDKDWDAILKFNGDLYQEELRQEDEKKRQQKTFIKSELDKQLEEKKKIRSKEIGELGAYNDLQKRYVNSLDNKEKEKELNFRKQKVSEKERLDSQLREEKRRRLLMEQDDKIREKTLVEKNKIELDEEKSSYIKKKQIEREYHKKMMEENEENKRRQSEKLKLQKEQETRDLEQYAKVLEQQEADRVEEIKGRERKTQELMNRMADTVIKENDKKKEQEEKKILRYQQEKEEQERLDEEERLKRVKDTQKEMRAYLDRQTAEKVEKVKLEKQDNAKLAAVWNKEVNMFAEEEKNIKQKVLNVNKQHADYLKEQMSSNKKKVKKEIMNREEYLMNKRIIEDIESKSNTKTPDAEPK
jgi:hypothetical protein